MRWKEFREGLRSIKKLPFSERWKELKNNVVTYCWLMLVTIAAVIGLWSYVFHLSGQYDHRSSKHKKLYNLGIFGTVISVVFPICALLVWFCRPVRAAAIPVPFAAPAPQPMVHVDGEFVQRLHRNRNTDEVER